MKYHVIIAVERRHSSRPQAISIGGADAQGAPLPQQLHSMGDSIADLNDPQLLYVAEWDFQTPYVRVLKGSIADLRMAYAGWPMIDEPTWRSQNPETP